MSDVTILVQQVLEFQRESASRLEVLQGGLDALNQRLDAQGSSIKDLTDSVKGSGDASGLQTRLVVVEKELHRLSASVDKLAASDSVQRDEIKEITTKFKIFSALLGLGTGGGGAAIAILAQKLLQ